MKKIILILGVFLVSVANADEFATVYDLWGKPIVKLDMKADHSQVVCEHRLDIGQGFYPGYIQGMETKTFWRSFACGLYKVQLENVFMYNEDDNTKAWKRIHRVIITERYYAEVKTCFAFFTKSKVEKWTPRYIFLESNEPCVVHPFTID